MHHHHGKMFRPSAIHNAVSMVDGTTYEFRLDELAAYMDGGGTLREPINEVAYGKTRVFLELDGPVPPDLEDCLISHVLKMGHHVDDAYNVTLRSGSPNGPRFHVVYPNIVLPTQDYHALIKALQDDGRFPALDKTCNDSKAWLRFPLTPKVRKGTAKEQRLAGRKYHLVKGKYRDAFINPLPRATPIKTPSESRPITRSGLVCEKDTEMVEKEWPGTVLARRGYIDRYKRTYFTRGRAWCEKGQRFHAKRPITIHVGPTGVWQGVCDDPRCKNVASRHVVRRLDDAPVCPQARPAQPEGHSADPTRLLRAQGSKRVGERHV